MGVEKESEGMLEKMKRGIKMLSPFSSENTKDQIEGMNLPARLGRIDSAYENLTTLFRSKLFLLEDHERTELYKLGLKLLDAVIANLNYIHAEKSNFKTSDPCLPVLTTLRKIVEVLRFSAEASTEMEKNENSWETFGGPLVIAKLRLVDDSVGDMEISLLHHVAELFEILSPTMQKNSELRRKQLTREECERYRKTCKEFSGYYSSLCKING